MEGRLKRCNEKVQPGFMDESFYALPWLVQSFNLYSVKQSQTYTRFGPWNNSRFEREAGFQRA